MLFFFCSMINLCERNNNVIKKDEAPKKREVEAI